MIGYKPRVQNSRRSLVIATVGLISAAAFVFIWQADDGEPSNGRQTGSIIIDASASAQNGALPQVAAVPLSPRLLDNGLPDGLTMAGKIAGLLPALQEVVAECSGASCVVNAKVLGSQTEGGQHILERVASNDIPTALSQSGLKLTEPLQIEETGAGESRIVLRIMTN